MLLTAALAPITTTITISIRVNIAITNAAAIL